MVTGAVGYVLKGNIQFGEFVPTVIPAPTVTKLVQPFALRAAQEPILPLTVEIGNACPADTTPLLILSECRNAPCAHMDTMLSTQFAANLMKTLILHSNL
jgi:hypothetical protein